MSSQAAVIRVVGKIISSLTVSTGGFPSNTGTSFTRLSLCFLTTIHELLRRGFQLQNTISTNFPWLLTCIQALVHTV